MPRETARDRGDEFLFNPGHFMTDESVLAMTPAGRGAYALLFCALWHQPEPGVVRYHPRVLASLARVGEDVWAAVEEEVSAAFDTLSRPGWWVQKRLALTYANQTQYMRAQAAAGKRGGANRWGTRAASVAGGNPIATPWQPCTGTGNGVGGTGDLERPLEEAKTPGQLALTGSDGAPLAPRRGLKASRLDARESLPEGEITADEAFEAVFWPAYPRKKDKQEAHRAWRELKFRDTDEAGVAALLADLRHDIAKEWVGWPAEKIPYPATWLRRRKPVR